MPRSRVPVVVAGEQSRASMSVASLRHPRPWLVHKTTRLRVTSTIPPKCPRRVPRLGHRPARLASLATHLVRLATMRIDTIHADIVYYGNASPVVVNLAKYVEIRRSTGEWRNEQHPRGKPKWVATVPWKLILAQCLGVHPDVARLVVDRQQPLNTK